MKKLAKNIAVMVPGILLLVGLAACGGNAPTQGYDDYYGNNNVNIADNSPRTIHEYADRHIENLAQELNVAIFDYDDMDTPIEIRPANIIETRISTLEKEAEFDHIMPYTIELWRLDFMLLTDDLESETLRWGTFSPDADGWVGQHTGWNDARTLLVFSRENDDMAFLGSIAWWMEETPYGLEGALRTFLEHEGILQAPIDDVSTRVSEILELLQTGINIAELELALNVAPQRVVDAYDGRPTYRFDLITVPGYEYISTHDSVDWEGLRDGTVKIIVFATFDEAGILERYSVYYSSATSRIYKIGDGIRTDMSDALG